MGAHTSYVVAKKLPLATPTSETNLFGGIPTNTLLNSFIATTKEAGLI
jgi:hypothetical protein